MKIRDGHPDDATAIARMINAFNEEEGSPGRMTAEAVTALCFSEQRLYKTLIADEDGDLVGYALIMRHFDTDPCAYCAYMQDLYVAPERRSQRVGQRLIASAARYALDQGWSELVWHVRDRNTRGRAFYARIGGEEQTVIPVTLTGEALRKLADEAAGA